MALAPKCKQYLNAMLGVALPDDGKDESTTGLGASGGGRSMSACGRKELFFTCRNRASFRYIDREKNGGAAAVCRAAGAAHHGAKCRRRRPSRGGAVRALFEPVILHYIVCFIVCYIVCPTHFPVNKANSYPEVNPQGRRRRRRRSDGDGGCGDAGSAAAAAATTAQRRQQWR